MRSIKMLLLGLALSGSVLFLSCGDNETKACDYQEGTQDTLEATTVAENAYSANPTPANCMALKDAYNAYIQDLEDHRDCASKEGQLNDLESDINIIDSHLDQLPC